MKMIIFTGHYPYKEGECFFNNEIQILSKHFEEILVISGSKNINCKDMYTVPGNVNVVIVNRYYKMFTCISYGLLKLFSFEAIKELYFAIVKLKYKFNLKTIKEIFLYYAVYKRLSDWLLNNLKESDENLIFYSYWLSESAYTLAKLKKNGRISKAISRAHGGDAFLDRGYNPFRREIYEYLDQIHFVSGKALLQFEGKISLPLHSNKAELYVSYLGTVNNEKFFNPVSKYNEYFTVLSCSNIIPLKRLDLIVTALSNIEIHNIKWIHFGDGIYKNVILELVNKKLSHLSNMEVNFKGKINNEEILDFYEKHHVDLFINVSDYEGIPVSIMEAMSYGIPVIARNVGGNSEIVKNGYNGILLPRHTNAQEVSQSILTLINLPQGCIDKYRKNAYETWKYKFNAGTNYKAFVKNIKRMLD